MNKLTRRLGTLALLGAAAMTLVGCGSNAKGGGEDAVGQLALPLVTTGASGTYRLRDATFAIHPECYIYGSAGTGAGGFAGSGMGGCGETIVLSSEDDPNAQSLSVSLEEGSYYVELLDGWRLEKEGPMGAADVEATLISGATQYVWVWRQGTSFAEYRFGLGGRELWLNGQLNIGVTVCEDPNEPCYGGTGGGSGTGGSAGTGGSSPMAGTAGTFAGGTGGSGWL
jgi:hypothetical protein